MRTLHKNEQTVYYALYLGTEDAYDDDGNLTPEQNKSYSMPVKANMNISPAGGKAVSEQYGINTPYSKTLVTDDLACPVAEDSILWIDSVPDGNGENGTVKHNYSVSAVAKGINSITIIAKKVGVS